MTEPNMNHEELGLLIRKYQQPDAKSMVNYLNFYNDLMSKSKPKGGTSKLSELNLTKKEVSSWSLVPNYN